MLATLILIVVALIPASIIGYLAYKLIDSHKKKALKKEKKINKIKSGNSTSNKKQAAKSSPTSTPSADANPETKAEQSLGAQL